MQACCLINEPLSIVNRIGLGQNQHRIGAGLVGHDQIALQPGRIEIGIAGRDDKQRIDIGSGKLLAVAAFRAPLQDGLALQPADKFPVTGLASTQSPTAKSAVLLW